MQLDTKKTIYVCTDGENGEVKLLVPKDFPFEIQELKLDERDPSSPLANDVHEHHLLKEEMTETTYEL